MAENLKTTRYNDGIPIPNVTVDSIWSAFTTGAYCDYSNNEANSSSYGRLYNWYAVASTNPQKVCPAGWKVPSDADWTILTTFIGDESDAGGKLKETGTTHWSSPNTGATNETGFTALPGAYRESYGTFYESGPGFYGIWWSSKEHQIVGAWFRRLSYDDSRIGYNFDVKTSGFSVRCVMN
jgi:uncharacterized protein (TIGR02145 family)